MYLAREPPIDLCTLWLRTRIKLNDHRVIRQIGLLATKMLDLVLVFVSKIVKPKAIGLLVHEGYQFGLQDDTAPRPIYIQIPNSAHADHSSHIAWRSAAGVSFLAGFRY